ncbi:protein mesh [Folsomia candida]|uniref:protein mesh n=1 Tax=Folsomia candida TaxID=158441 RepID=UPI000B90616A|nr:protein mesh [Folsomia candida]
MSPWWSPFGPTSTRDFLGGLSFTVNPQIGTCYPRREPMLVTHSQISLMSTLDGYLSQRGTTSPFMGPPTQAKDAKEKNKRNTFQLALTTDGFHSFAIFYYNNITWTTGHASNGNPCTGLGGQPAKAGFDYGDGSTFYTIPTSCSADVINVTETSNVASPGKWVFRIDNEVEQGGCEGEDLSSLRLRTSPSFISILGHVPLTLTGPCLSNASRVNCIFHDREKQVVPATVVDPATAECLVPYLYTNGRVTVELEYEILINSSIEHRNVSGYIYTIPPPDYKLNFSIHEMGSVQVTWDPENFPDEALLEMDVAQFNGTSWVDHGVLVVSVPNSGIYEGPVNNVNVLSGINQTFVASLKPLSGFEGQHWLLDNYLYSGLLHTNYGKTENTFDAWCQSWYELDPGPPTNIRPCPPLLEQAQQDLNFVRDTISGSLLEFYHPGAEASFRERNPIGQSGQQCIYKGGQILIGPPGGGTADLYSPNGILGILGHQWHDVRPWFYCCKWSANREESCRKYYAKRPSDAGTTYVPPRPGNGAGDPHITTFDLLTYTFNGVGEFWMIKDTGFGMQARMEQYVNPETQEAMYASIFTGFSFLVKGEAQVGAQNSQVKVQVQLLPQIQGGGMQVLLDSVAIDLLSDDMEPLTISHFGVFITILGRRQVTLAFSLGYTFNFISLDGVSINIEASASAQLRGLGNPRGLLGIFDGDNANDLTDPDGNILPITSNTETIHRSFGTKWKTTEADSLFSYRPGKSHASYQNEGFLPSFGTPGWSTLPENVRETCGNDQACVFDYVNTGSITFANNTKQVGFVSTKLWNLLRRLC